MLQAYGRLKIILYVTSTKGESRISLSYHPIEYASAIQKDRENHPHKLKNKLRNTNNKSMTVNRQVNNDGSFFVISIRKRRQVDQFCCTYLRIKLCNLFLKVLTNDISN